MFLLKYLSLVTTSLPLVARSLNESVYLRATVKDNISSYGPLSLACMPVDTHYQSHKKSPPPP